MHWYIIQTNPNCERKAIGEIRRAGFRAHMPRLAKMRRHHRTKKPIIKRRALMTGYIFVRFPDVENWYALRKCQGVKGVLYVDGHPFKLAREHVASIMRAQRSMRYEDGETRATRRKLQSGYRDVGAAVRASKLDGFRTGRRFTAVVAPGERVLARVIAVTKKGTVKALVEMGGRETAVEFTDANNLELVDDRGEAA